MRHKFFIPVFVLVIAILWSLPSMARSRGSRFPGFAKGQSGFGFHLGWPIGGRYQYWLDWKTATFFDFGYQTDGYLMGGANYAYYLLSEDDRWRMDRRVGTLMFYGFGGATAGLLIDGDRDEKARLGLRLGGGLEYMIPKSNFSARFEVSPVLFLSGTTAGGLQGGLILMYYFDRPQARYKIKKKRKADEDIDFSDFEEEFDEKPKKKKKKKKRKKKKRKKRVKKK